MNKKIVGLLSVIVILIIGLFVINIFLQKEVVDATPSVIEDNTIVDTYVVTKDMIIVPNQAAGSEIFIERVELTSGGYVLISRSYTLESDMDMDNSLVVEAPEELPGDTIGISDYLEAGVHENFIVKLKEGEETTVGERVIATVHTESKLEDDAHNFNPEEDLRSIVDNGVVVMDIFTILADDAPGFETKL